MKDVSGSLLSQVRKYIILRSCLDDLLKREKTLAVGSFQVVGLSKWKWSGMLQVYQMKSIKGSGWRNKRRDEMGSHGLECI